MLESSKRSPREFKIDLSELLDYCCKVAAVAFMILLVVAAVELGVGSEKLANTLAEYAYYCLVAAVLLLIISMSLERRGIVLTIRLPHLHRQRLATLVVAVSSLLVYTSMTLVGAVGMASIPGRPTINEPAVVVSKAINLPLIHTAVAILFMLVCWLASTPWLLVTSVLSAISIGLCLASFYWLAGIIGVAAALTPLSWRQRLSSLYLSLGVAGCISLLTLLVPQLSWISWLWSAGSTYSSLVACFALSIGLIYLYLTRRIRLVESVGGSMTASVIGFSALLATAIASPLIPHFLYGINRIIALDTMYNIKFCNLALKKGLLLAGLKWYRPLYVLVTCPLAWTIGLKLFYDIIVHAIGLIILGLATLLLLRASGVDWTTSSLAALAMVLMLSPAYVYSGFQTALLALPLGLTLLYLAQYSMQTSRRLPLALLAVVSLTLGLWHPWTLAYYSASAVLLAIALRETPIDRRALSLLLAMMPGLTAYSLVLLAAGKPAIMPVVVAVAKPAQPLAWALHNYYWGTLLRGDLYLAVALSMAIIMASRGVRRGTLWVYVASLPPLLLVVVSPAGWLTLRMLATAPLPVIAVLEPREKYKLAVVLAATGYWLQLLVNARPLV